MPALGHSPIQVPAAEELGLRVQVVLGQGLAVGLEQSPVHRLPSLPVEAAPSGRLGVLVEWGHHPRQLQRESGLRSAQSRRDDGSLGASIVDPHGDHLADAKAKPRGLANYAERFDDRFVESNPSPR